MLAAAEVTLRVAAGLNAPAGKSSRASWQHPFPLKWDQRERKLGLLLLSHSMEPKDSRAALLPPTRRRN
jgi:hypothetical protein